MRLLADCRAVFEVDRRGLAGNRRAHRPLIEREESPWGDLFGRPITARKLASLLRPYDVRPSHWRIGGGTSVATSAAPSKTLGPVICILNWHNRHRCRFAGVSIPKRHSREVCHFKKAICRDVPLVPVEMDLGGIGASHE